MALDNSLSDVKRHATKQFDIVVIDKFKTHAVDTGTRSTLCSNIRKIPTFKQGTPATEDNVDCLLCLKKLVKYLNAS